MSISYEDIKKANEACKPIEVKNKYYMEVNQRIKAFRMVYPEGFIFNDLISNEGGICIFRSKVGYYTEDGNSRILGIGTAFEKQDSTFINKTSYIENCETSACGRALGMAGFGIDVSIASAEEVQNAMANQQKDETITEKEQTVLKNMVEQKGYAVEEIFPKGLNLTAEQYTKAVSKVAKMPKKGETK